MRIILLAGLLFAVLLPTMTASSAVSDPIIILEVQGVINTLTVEYLQRTIGSAAEQDAQLVVINLDTPGGLETAMRDIIQILLSSDVPVAVFVTPEGARAASAGMFILLASDIAAMSPATNVGAAHPLPLGSELNEIEQTKLAEDAAAFVRSIAESRGRNAQWAEQAVRENLAVTASEALALGVIELIAEDLDDLLAQIDARGDIDLDYNPGLTPLVRDEMNLIERFFHIITEPNIAYLLLTIGTIMLLAEIADPGLSVAGVGAGLAFIIAFLGLGSLPVNWAGIGLIALTFIIFLIGLLTDTEIVVTLLGLVPFVLGSLLIFSPFNIQSPASPDLRVSLWLIAVMAIIIMSFSFFILRAILAALRRPPRSGPQRLIGLEAETLTALDPVGQVKVETETWSALAVKGKISKGSKVRVKGIKGVRLEVTPLDNNGRDQEQG